MLFRAARSVAGTSRLCAPRYLSGKAAKPPLVASSLNDKGVLTLTFQQEKKLNAWTLPLMEQFAAEIDAAKTRDDVNGVVITGSGNYYSAGVDLSALLKPMAPSKLVLALRTKNQAVFDQFINFNKPIAAAINGPAIGAAVTTATLTDVMVASETATFSLPFAKVGVPAEGCSSVTFSEWMGQTVAQRMLGPEMWIPTAAEAKEVGFPIAEIVPGGNAALVARAVELVEARIARGGGRRFDEAERVRLARINADESARLANAVVSPPFLEAMKQFNQKRNPQVAFFFSAAKATLPLWRPAPVEPAYNC